MTSTKPRISPVTEKNAHEMEVHRWFTEASTLGFQPGEAPRSLDAEIGNKRRFLLLDDSSDESRLVYRQEFGCLILVVYND